MLPNANGHHSHLALALAAADIPVLFASAFIVGSVRVRSNGSVLYGDLAAIGGAGRCPLNVPAEKLPSGYAGCGLDSVGSWRNAFDGGPVGYVEGVFHGVAAPIYIAIKLKAVYCFFAELIVALDFLLSLCGRRRRHLFTPKAAVNSKIRHNRLKDISSDDITLADFASGEGATAHPGGRRDQNDADDHPGWLSGETTGQSCVVFILGIIVYTVVFFLVHYVQQTRQRTVAVLDSLGPLVRGGDMLPAVLNGTSWSDWFRVAQPWIGLASWLSGGASTADGGTRCSPSSEGWAMLPRY